LAERLGGTADADAITAHLRAAVGLSRAYGVLLMDAAHLSQSFYLVCTQLGLGAFFTAAINSANIDDRLGLEVFSEGALAVSGCGHRPPDTTAEPTFASYAPRPRRA
jgi:nitroreductase